MKHPLLYLVFCGFLLGSCQAAPSARLERAQELASSASMREHDIAAGSFLLRSYERISDPLAGHVRVYIEGDGLAWLGRTRPSPDPTPLDPMALRLAHADDAGNVVYLARPCQYNGPAAGYDCPPAYWTSARFSPAVIEAMGFALDDLRKRHGVRSFELVGYSGGAAIAVLLAARRDDIAEIRTVAGNLDTEAFCAVHNVSPLTGSLNPAAAASKVAHIPQIHFIGGKDEVVPPALFDSYRASAGFSSCIEKKMVPEATHKDGWAENWRSLLGMMPVCVQTG